jgi:hydrogenase maturation protein HypF
MLDVTRIRVLICGSVQGVGFRPFIYRLATEMGLTGWVSNSPQGVVIEIEGPKAHLDAFLIRAKNQHPARASIASIEHSSLAPLGSGTFEIRLSAHSGPKQTAILPDIATCSDCLAEIFDPENRRYLYPFTNCTHCGPRFTIIENLPYDRANTTMRKFTMCDQCRAEYLNPLDRRFHAQPNACRECGPHLKLWDRDGQACAIPENAVATAAAALNSGKIVALKGLGGFHLLVDATNEDAVKRLRLRKHREEKPFAVMAPALDSVRMLCKVNPREERLLVSSESPIVILRSRSCNGIATSVAPRNPNLGVMLPNTPLHHIVMREVARPLVATSGNHSDEPISIDEDDALERLGEIADLFLVHNRPIRRHVDDSIVRDLLGRPQIIRRARGYAPLPIMVNDALPPTVAAGAHLKNTVALAVPTDNGSAVVISQHIGDLETKEASAAFHAAINDLQRLYDIRPDVIARDLHPDFPSSPYAAAQTERVQHHWAHVMSCMAEHNIDAPVLGVAWDGAGYGPDGTIWGGEFLLATRNSFDRAAHLRTFPLPGGDAAVKKPKHIALGLLYEIFGDQAFDGIEPPLLRQMLRKGIRAPRTSSAGRLFDAVASIVGIRSETSFEGQAAMELEFAAADNTDEFYPYAIRSCKPLIVDWEPMLRTVLADVRELVPAGIISARFHNTLVEIIVDIAERIGESRVVLTGGCFQNRYLIERTVNRLSSCGFSAYWHERVPTNDGGISLGQILAAGRKFKQYGVRPLVAEFSGAKKFGN